MYRDLQKGGPIEADQIIGDLFARASARPRADAAIGDCLHPSHDLPEQAIAMKTIGMRRQCDRPLPNSHPSTTT